MEFDPQTAPQIPNGLKPCQLTIRSEMSGGAFTHSIWRDGQRIATDIASFEDAQTVSAAPELLEFARTLLKLVRADTDEAPSIPEIVRICQKIAATVEGLAETASPAPSDGLPPLPSHRNPPAGITAAVAKATASNSQLPLFDKVFKSTVRQIRTEATDAGWTLQRLSSELGMSRAQFSRWEKSIPKTVRAVTKLQTAVRTDPSRNSSTRA